MKDTKNTFKIIYFSKNLLPTFASRKPFQIAEYAQYKPIFALKYRLFFRHYAKK